MGNSRIWVYQKKWKLCPKPCNMGRAIRTIEITVQFRNVLKWYRWALTESLVKVVRHPFDYIHIEWSQTTRKKIEVCQKNCTCCACTICLKSFNSFPNCSTSHLIWCKRFLKSQMKKLKIFRLESPFLGNRFSELKRLCVGIIPDWRHRLTKQTNWKLQGLKQEEEYM